MAARGLAGLLLTLPLTLAAQKAAPEPIRFGQIDAKELTAVPFAPDSAAAAVVLCDYGTTRFEGHGAGLRLVFDRITRMKILTKAGYDWATVAVPLYHQDGQNEELGRVRGCTYNLGAGGKVEKTPLADASLLSEELTDHVRVRKFTLPAVREGSVIEYAYTLKSDFLFNLQDWTFQREIPTRWSEYRTTIPGFYRYKIIQQTNRPFAVFNERLVAVTLGVENRVGEGSLSAGQSLGQMTVTAQAVESRWVMQNLPAYREEPFTTAATDYLIRLNFELAGTQWEGEAFHDLSETWPKINARLLADENFGLQLKRGDFLKAQLLALAAKYPDPAQRAAAVRALVLQAVRYDGTDRCKTTASLKKALEAHRGTSADVNLLLLAALRQAGLPAQPVLLSTRDHGQVSRDFPLLEKFNYVVGLLELPGGAAPLLLDATEPLLPCGVLPERCLNRTGRLIAPAPAEGRWVDLTPTERHVYYQQAQLALAPDGSLSGTVHEEHAGYAAADERAELAQLGEKKYLAAQTALLAGGTVPTAAVAGREALDKPLQINYAFAQPAEDGAAPAGLLYLSPLQVLGTSRNPFPHAERQQAVDFGAAREQTQLVTLTLPAGYELAERPKNLVATLPDGGGGFTFAVAATGATVQLSSRLILRKPVYAPAEYAHLRDLYRLLLEKHAEKLIIKKKA